tara:strand:+ start:1223 stop:1876 length:654 start_codon:yes stop_codon:yes gene_type:complete
MTNVTKASVINFIMAKLDGTDVTADRLNAMSVDKLLQKYNYTLNDVSEWMTQPTVESIEHPDNDVRDAIISYIVSCNSHINPEKLNLMTTGDMIDRFMLNIDDVIKWQEENNPLLTWNNNEPANADNNHNTRKFTINFRDGANAIAVFTKTNDGSWKLSYKSTRLRWMDDDQKIYNRDYDPTNPEPRKIIETIPRTDETNLNWCLSQPNYDEQYLTV